MESIACDLLNGRQNVSIQSVIDGILESHGYLLHCQGIREKLCSPFLNRKYYKGTYINQILIQCGWRVEHYLELVSIPW